MKLKLIVCLFSLFIVAAACSQEKPQNKKNVKTAAAANAAKEAKPEVWDKVFDKSDKVDVQKVSFTNRYGIALSGDLYLPKERKYFKAPAIAVSGPFGAVKEQASGLYAQQMAQRGYIALAFDPSFTGESSGMPRNVASPDINTEDFSAAVDFLSTFPIVDENKIGVIGICGFGGFALNAAAADTRIKGTVSSTMYDMTRITANGYNDTMDKQARYALREQLSEQRTKDYEEASYAKAPGLPDKLTGSEPPTALKLHTLRGDLQKWTKYFELIKAGTHYLSVREWAGRPRQSAQVEVLRLTKDNLIGLQRLDFVFDKTGKSFTVMVDRKVIPVDKLANNDGLSLNDWLAWMKDEDLTQPMAVVQFTQFRY